MTYDCYLVLMALAIVCLVIIPIGDVDNRISAWIKEEKIEILKKTDYLVLAFMFTVIVYLLPLLLSLAVVTLIKHLIKKGITYGKMQR